MLYVHFGDHITTLRPFSAKYSMSVINTSPNSSKYARLNEFSDPLMYCPVDCKKLRLRYKFKKTDLPIRRWRPIYSLDELAGKRH